MKPNARAILLALTLSVAAAAIAQEKPVQRPPAPPIAGERAGLQMLERIRFMLGELKLSPEQKTKVDAVFKKANTELETLRNEMQSMEPRDRMARVSEFFREVRDDLAALLNDEQREILDKRIEEARQGMRNRGPGAAPPGGGDAGPTQRPGEVLERIGQAVQKLDLTEGQRVKLRDLMQEVQSKTNSLRQQGQAGENVREQVRRLVDDTRRAVDDVLTPVQQQKLREMLRDGAPVAGAAAAKPPPATQAMMMDGNEMMMGGEKKTTSAKKAPAPGQKLDPSAAQVGSPAPQLALKKIDGSQFTLSSLRGRVVVIEFGSYTCPAFRERALAMEKLKLEYGTRAQFFIVYAREAHAKGEWEVGRNKDAEITVDQPTSLDARIDLAKKTRDELKITIPILVDTLGNDAIIAYGAGVNSAFVINRDGMIVARQQWCDPSGLRRAIDEAAKAAPATKPVF